MAVTVSPEQFTLVEYDAAEIASIAGELAEKVGLGDRDIRIEVDEKTPLGSSAVVSLDPITITVESGGFEDAKQLRHLSRESVEAVVGRHFMRTKDRLDPAFGAPPEDDKVPIELYTAWDIYAVGRLERLGYPSQRERRRYHFRIRHGFTDAADRVFDRLWEAGGLTWADIEAASAEAMAAKPAPPVKAKAKAGRTS
ncbi:MAG: hypothetical protein JOZ68_12250 [Acidimicrobiia bacterium]|nr:hypothetical protein [Acidimicrobiia bacterium]MBV9041772.1 hypothetical protein [Acidimicrobiia bacterium]